MSRNKMRKLPTKGGIRGEIQRGDKKRGMGTVQRSASGGAVKGPIPKPGGTNKMSFMKNSKPASKTMLKKGKSGGGGY